MFVSETTLVKVTDSILRASEIMDVSALVLLDHLSTTFYKISQSIQLQRLKHVAGIMGGNVLPGRFRCVYNNKLQLVE